MNKTNERKSKMPTCDLHIHSDNSDGTCTPEELIDIAKQSGVTAVALCDHNTIAGVNKLCKAAENSGITAIAGVEVTTEYKGDEVHILGLFLKEEYFEKLTDFLKQINLIKTESNKELVRNLKNGGFDIEYEEVTEKAGIAIPNRVHFAKVLIDKGYTSSIAEAFSTMLAKGGEYYKPAKKLDTLLVISFLASIKAVPVMAHPLVSLSRDKLEELIPKAKSCGLTGMECYYSLYSEEETAYTLSLAEKNGVLPCGGSDFHGENKPDIKMGSGKGNLAVPIDVFYTLKEVADRL